MRTSRRLSRKERALTESEVEDSPISEDKVPLKPVKSRGKVVPLYPFDDDDDDEIPALHEYTGTLNKRLKELDIQACGGRYSSKDQVPKDPAFFAKITRAIGIEDRLVLAFGLPRQLSSKDGYWLCPSRQCEYVAPKIENLYAHIAASEVEHEGLKPVIRQSFCRPCRQFCKNPAGVLAHEMSHSAQSDCYERNRLTRLLRVLDDEEDAYRSFPIRRSVTRKHILELGANTSTKAPTRKRKRPGKSPKATNRQRRAAPSKNPGLQRRREPTPSRVLRFTRWRSRSNSNSEQNDDQGSSFISNTPEPCVTSEDPEPSSDGPRSVSPSASRTAPAHTFINVDDVPSNHSPTLSFILSEKSENLDLLAKSTEPFVDNDSVDATAEAEVRNIFRGITSSPEFGPLSPKIGPSSREHGPRSPGSGHGPSSKSEYRPHLEPCLEELLLPVSEYLADQNSSNQGYGDIADLENPSAIPSYIITETGTPWREPSTSVFEYPEIGQYDTPSPWRAVESSQMTLPSFYHDIVGSSNAYEDLLSSCCNEGIADFSESDLDGHKNRQREEYSPVPLWSTVNSIERNYFDTAKDP